MLETAVLNSYFLFNGEMYKQTDGVGVVLPLGPTFANIFLCHHEQKSLKDCPHEFRPAYYRRYVDDCFLVFNDRSHIDRFMTYLNSQHPKIRFTKEVESNGCMSFLDLNLRCQNNKLEISIFRKATFTGLGLSFFSFIPSTVKKSVVVSAVTRAFRLTSSYQLFDCELNFLRKFFQNNGFPKQLTESVIRYVLDKVFLPRVPTSLTVRRLEKYFCSTIFWRQVFKLTEGYHRNSCKVLSLSESQDCAEK